MSDQATPGLGHNRGPITPPSETEALADLKARFPNVEVKFRELEEAFNSAPKRIENDEDAGKVQDLYRSMVEFADDWDESRKKEKKPWDKIGKIVQNFFSTPIEKLKDKDTGYAPLLRKRHTEYSEIKAEAARKEAERLAEIQRKEAERLRAEAEAAEQRRIEAERLQREAEEREAKALAEEAAAKERRRLADEAAERARAEEKRIAAEKAERERGEKEAAKKALREAEKLIKEANGLFSVTEGDEEAEANPRLDEIVRRDGALAQAIGPAMWSHLLTAAEMEDRDAILARALEIRRADMARLDAKARKKKEAEERKRQAEDEKLAAQRKAAREADEARAAEARRQREEAEADATKAKQEAKDARKDVRAAQGDQDDAADAGRAAEREGRQIGGQADKVERRADRLDNKLATSSDADMSRTRGDYSVGSLSGRWSPRVVDRDELVKTLGLLGPYLNPDAVDAALTKYMRQHQGEWADKRKAEIVSGLIPGVLFDWIPDSRIV